MFKKLPRSVIVLGFVSFFNDLASEMIYPIVPLFLTTVLHTSVPIIGLIEGLAEATASLTKYYFGAFSDSIGKRKIFVTTGYGFGAISKLLIGLAASWQMVLFARVIDRIGKGIRTAPRDSILLENSTKQNKGYVFGFHRAFDSLGAVFGPLLALLLLFLLKNNIRLTFFIAFIPGVIAILLLIFFIKEKNKLQSTKKPFAKIAFRQLDTRLKLFLVVSVLFALGNSADTFLLLRAQNLGLGTTLVVAVYVLYNLAQTIFATPAGYIADKLGAKNVYLFGLLVFALVYFAFGFVHQSMWLWFLFPLYGIYIAATDGVSKSYVAEFITKEESGTYFGAYYTLTAIGTLFASVIGGLLWYKVAPQMTFYYGSLMAFLAFLFLIMYEQLRQKKLFVKSK